MTELDQAPVADDVQFPVDNIDVALPQLRRPFAAGAAPFAPFMAAERFAAPRLYC